MHTIITFIVLIWNVPNLPVQASIECVPVEAQSAGPRVFVAQGDGWIEESARSHAAAVAHCAAQLHIARPKSEPGFFPDR